MSLAQGQLRTYAPRACEALAPFYERTWAPESLDDAINLFDQFLASRVPAGGHILDLCCGVGDFGAWLRSSGLRVTGVDASSSMVEYARRKSPGSQFCVADLRSLCLPARFDAAVWLHHGVDQVLTLQDLRFVLRSVGPHLQPGGWFLFDVVIEEGHERFWNADESAICDGRRCELIYRYKGEGKLAFCRVTVSDPLAERDVESYVFFQRPYSAPLLLMELHRSGFQFIEVAKSAGVSPRGRRIAIVARRGPGPDARGNGSLPEPPR